MCFCIDDENLLGQYEAIWTKIEDLENIELNALPVYDDRFIKIKIRTYSNNSANSVIESHKSFWVQRKFLLHDLIWSNDLQKNVGANRKMVN